MNNRLPARDREAAQVNAFESSQQRRGASEAVRVCLVALYRQIGSGFMVAVLKESSIFVVVIVKSSSKSERCLKAGCVLCICVSSV